MQVSRQMDALFERRHRECPDLVYGAIFDANWRSLTPAQLQVGAAVCSGPGSITSSSQPAPHPYPPYLAAQTSVLMFKRLCCVPCPLQAEVRRVLQPLKASPPSGTAELQDLYIFLSNAVHSSKLRGVLMKEMGGWVHQSAGHVGRWHLHGALVGHRSMASGALFLPRLPQLRTDSIICEHLLRHRACQPCWPMC